ncbi:hypothetical protein GOV11_00535 [Candidatus Woesearchaeota archaeon]|nr:hypothetical protein [Candidatus Woesearchaeota archaeon]
MNRERVEEFLLLTLALGTLSYLVPSTVGPRLIITILLAIGLIALLVLRSIDWRNETNPYDWILILGIIVAILHLFSFSAFESSPLGLVIILLLGIYYTLMAVLLYRHRWLFRGNTRG